MATATAESFKSQVLEALGAILETIPEDELRRNADETPEDVAKRFAMFRLARNEWDELVGPFLDTSGVIEWVGYRTRDRVYAAVKQGDLLAVPAGRRLLFPIFQFSRSGDRAPRLREVLSILSEYMKDPWTRALWLNVAVPEFDGLTATEMMHRGEAERVLVQARRDVERLKH